MRTTLTISDALAQALEARRQQSGLPTLDAVAEALLMAVIAVDADDTDDLGLSQDALRTLIAEGEASGPTVAWDMNAVRDEIHRRFAARKAR